MSKMKKSLSNLTTGVKTNAVEIWAAFSIFIGLPIVAYVYFDYKAALLVFFVLSSLIGVQALRVKG